MKPHVENTAEAIRAEIDQTRHRMDDTIDALGERFKGSHLIDEALHLFRTQTQNGNMNKFTESITRSADSAARSVVDTVKTNPIPAVLIGAGVAYFLYSRSQAGASESDYRVHRYRTGDEHDYGEGSEVMNPATLESGTYPEGGSESAGEGEGVGSRLQEFGGQMRDKAQSAVEGAKEMGHEVAERSRQLYREGRDYATTTIEEHPLQSGLVCLALGLLAGVALPTSEKVKNQVRPQARALRRGARSMVDRGRQVVRSAADAARHEAQSQGLTMDSLKAKASTVSRVATDAAEKSAGEQGSPQGQPAGATVATGPGI